MTLPPVPAHLTDIEFMRVLTTYVFAGPLLSDQDVLDAGCGTGHGTWLMAERGARSVLAVDLDPANAKLVRRISSEAGRVRGAVMDVQALGISDGRFDVVVCFEVIEHVPQPERLLGELRRTAARGALTLISTPNRRNRLRPGQRPMNPEHLREYDLNGLRATLEASYRCVRILGIYGRGDVHDRYLAEWRPTWMRQLRATARDALPASLRSLIRAGLTRIRHRVHARAPRAIVAPDPQAWPFYIDEVGETCLNFFALCSDDTGRVMDAVPAVLGARSASHSAVSTRP